MYSSPFIDNYQQLIECDQLKYDARQMSALQVLATLLDMINSNEREVYSHKQTILEKIRFLTKREKEPPRAKGVYLFGRVGRGKTMLMDLFFQHLTTTRKQRIHFHRFMQSVHKDLSLHTGKSDPLIFIAKTWSKKIDVLCFDEFYVSDIADAMLLAGLLDALFKNGVILITTSNCHPDQLYRNGLQKKLFLPAIALIKDQCQVISVDGEVDYRLVNAHQQSNYCCYSLISSTSDTWLFNHFKQYTKIIPSPGTIDINQRDINYLAKHDKVLWLTFDNLCSGPRSQLDYIKISDLFDVVLLANVPQFYGKIIEKVVVGTEEGYQKGSDGFDKMQVLDDEARRFIALVDEFYDRRVKLVITAEVDIYQLYQGTQLSFEFARCESRLIEMQSF